MLILLLYYYISKNTNILELVVTLKLLRAIKGEITFFKEFKVNKLRLSYLFNK